MAMTSGTRISEDSQRVPTMTLDRLNSAEDRFWLWRDALAILFDAAVESRAALATFDAHLQAYAYGSFVLVRMAGSAQMLRRSPTTVARSRIDHHLVRFHRVGGGLLAAAGREMPVVAGDISILDLSQPAEITLQPFDDALIILPREVLSPLVGDDDALHGLVAPGHTAAGAVLGAHLDSLLATAAASTRGEAKAIADGTLGVLAALIGRAIEVLDRVDASVASPLLVEIRRHIERDLASPDLGATALTSRFNLSRPSLYRAFASQGGIATYIRKRRLARTMRDITSPFHAHRRIGDIAYDWGFRNEAAFSRAFHATFGLSPRDARLAAASSNGLRAGKSGMKGAFPLSQWIWEIAEPDWLVQQTKARRHDRKRHHSPPQAAPR